MVTVLVEITAEKLEVWSQPHSRLIQEALLELASPAWDLRAVNGPPAPTATRLRVEWQPREQGSNQDRIGSVQFVRVTFVVIRSGLYLNELRKCKICDG